MNVPDGIDPELAQSQSAAANLPRGVPPLAKRWNNQMTFGDFTDATLNSYYQTHSATVIPRQPNDTLVVHRLTDIHG